MNGKATCRKRILSYLLVVCMLFTALCPASAVKAADTEGTAKATVIDVTKYGADPSGSQDSAVAIQKAIEAAKQAEGPVTLNFPKGEYHIYPDKAYERELYISNTVGQDQNYKMKKIGFLLEDMEDVTIEGNGSLFMFHGKMTTFATINCKNVKFQNYEFDFAVPTVVDLTVEEVEGNTATVYVPECYNYDINGTTITWKSDTSPYTGEIYWSFNNGANYSQRYSLKSGTTWRAGNPVFSNVSSVEELEHHRLKFTYSRISSDMEPGICIQMRPTVRDHAGMFFWKSKDVTMEEVGVHFLHGFGIVGQHSENITLKNVDFQTQEGSGRTTASYADFVQMSGCKGEILIDGCTFSNPHDDPINVHGTFNEVVERISDNQFKVRFMHNETAGFPNFFVGDEVEFISKSDMSAAENSVAKVTEVLGPTGNAGISESGTGSLTDMIVTLDRDMPKDITPGSYVIENITYTPSLTVQNCLFKEVPTRGILVTTRKPVVIRNNTFDGMTMASIYIESNATSWYESGGVRDLTIEGNVFYRPSTPAILISPTGSANKEKPVHRNIKIRDNTFYMGNGQVLSAKSTSGISFTGNRIYRYEPNVTVTMTADKTVLAKGEAVNLSGSATGAEQSSGLYYFNGCTGITLSDNVYDGGLNLRADLSGSDAIALGEGEEVRTGNDHKLPAVGTVRYESSDEEVVAITSSGFAVGRSAGTANVRAYTVVGGRKFASEWQAITVTGETAADMPAAISISGEKETTNLIGDEISYSVQVTPEGADDSVTWMVLDADTQNASSHAVIDENGKLTTVSDGVVEVAAITANGLEARKLLVINQGGWALGSTMANITPDSGNWRVLEDGRIQINARSQGIWATMSTHNNIILHSSSGDLTNAAATIKMSGKTAANYDEAGLVFYQDDDNYVTIQRKHGSGTPTIRLVTEEKQSANEDLYVSDLAQADIWLKLEKEGDTVKGYCSQDGSDWISVGEVTNPSLGNAFRIGMIAFSGQNSGTPFAFSDLTVNEEVVGMTEENHAPVAVNVSNTYEDGKLKAAWSFEDSDGNDQGETLIKWMAASEAEGDYELIPGMSGTDIAPTAKAAGKYVKAVVIPQDVNGMYGPPAEASSPVWVEEGQAGDEPEDALNADSFLEEAAFTGLDGFEPFNSKTKSYITTAGIQQKMAEVSLKARDGKAALEVYVNDRKYLSAEEETSEIENLPLELASGLNVILVKVIAENGETWSDYRFAVIRTGDDDTRLTSIRLNDVPLDNFDPDIYTYDYKAEKYAASLKIEAEGVPEYATVAIGANGKLTEGSEGTVSLVPGLNEVTIRVKPETMAPERFYRITVSVPKEDNANLRSLKFDTGVILDTPFETDITSYTGTANREKVSVTLAAEEANAQVELIAKGESLGKAANSLTAEVPLTLGENRIHVKVTSPDGTQVKVYTLDLTGSSEVWLSSIPYDPTSENGWQEFAMDQTVEGVGRQISLLMDDGTTKSFEKGVGAHAPMTLIYDIGGMGYEKFSAYLGVDQEANTSASVKIAIYLDGEQVFSSGDDIMGKNTPAKFVELNVAGKSQIKIVADDCGSNSNDHVSLGDAKLTVPMTEPEKTVYTVEYQADPAEAGILEAESGSAVTDNGFIQAEEGESVTLTAKARENYVFLGWYDADGTELTNETALHVSDVRSHAVYTAKFMERCLAAQKAAEEAQEAAEEAQAAAEAAQGKAEAAQTAAEEAKAKAEAAQAKAEEAQAEAEAAATQANEDKSFAEQAKEAAKNAALAAEEAQTKAEAAQTLAETARKAAEEAQGKAETAKQAAETAASAANDAKLDAEEAQRLAENARDEANTANDQAQAAAKTAGEAQAAAESARDSAATYAELAEAAKNAAEMAQKAAEAAQKAAETARDEAEQLLKQAQAEMNAKLAQAEEALKRAEKLQEQMNEKMLIRDFQEKKAAIKKVKSKKKKTVSITWKKVKDAEGYIVQYGTKASFKGAKSVTVKKGTATAKTIRKLKSKKTYYVRIRAYKTVNGEKIYTGTSAKKKIRVK